MLRIFDSDQRIRTSLLVGVALVFLLLGIAARDALPGSSLANLFHPNPASPASSAVTPQAIPDFTALVKQLQPVVVNISTSQEIKPNRLPNALDKEEAFGDARKRSRERPQGTLRRQSLGSGFIIDAGGLILTNNHVVDNAQKIMVKLADGREFEGKVVGRDAGTDIALVHIDPKEKLPVARLGDSDRLQVGEWVLAYWQSLWIGSHRHGGNRERHR